MRVTPDCDTINSFNICNANYTQLWPDVAFDGTDYMVIWTDRRSNTYYRLYGTRVTPQGTVVTPNGFPIGPGNSRNQYRPSICFNGTRHFIVWGYATAPYTVTGRFMETDGTLGDTVYIASCPTFAYNTGIAYDGTNYLVVWVEYNYSGAPIRGQFVSTDGSLIGSPFTITTSAYYYNALGFRFDGTNYIVTWASAVGARPIKGRKYDTAGNPVGNEFTVSNTSNACYYCDVCPGNDNHYLNIWSERIGSYYDIYANVDIEIVGTEEQEKVVFNGYNFGSTIVRGPLHLPPDKRCKVFDISGREVDPMRLAPGIYFIKTEDKITTKIIKIK